METPSGSGRESRAVRVLVVGIAIAAVVVLLVIGGALGLGRLPGDFSWERGSVRVYAPIVTCLLVSLVVSIVLSVISRRR